MPLVSSADYYIGGVLYRAVFLSCNRAFAVQAQAYKYAIDMPEMDFVVLSCHYGRGGLHGICL